MTTPLRIALVAPPLERVPPRAYGGTERVVYELILELQGRGHHVTLFASGDSDVPCELVPIVPEALRPAGFLGDPAPYFYQTVLDVLGRAREFDLIHSHLEWASVPLMVVSPVPVVSTFHGRLDFPFAERLLRDAPPGLVAISASQASTHPALQWSVVHNGLTLAGAPFDRRAGDDLCFVGRVNPEKGIIEAMEVARLAGRRLRIAAKIGTIDYEREFYAEVFKPALEGRSDVEYLGEISGRERDELMAESYATLMPGAWPEPFGLVAIESLACGTPIVARRVGALPEIIRPDIDGFFGDDEQQMAFLLDRVPSLDRGAIRASVLERFSATRMTDQYLDVYAATLEARGVVVEDSDRIRRLSPARAGARRTDAASSTEVPASHAAAPGGDERSTGSRGSLDARYGVSGSLDREPVGVMDPDAATGRRFPMPVDPRIVLATVPDRLLERGMLEATIGAGAGSGGMHSGSNGPRNGGPEHGNGSRHAASGGDDAAG